MRARTIPNIQSPTGQHGFDYDIIKEFHKENLNIINDQITLLTSESERLTDENDKLADEITSLNQEITQLSSLLNSLSYNDEDPFNDDNQQKFDKSLSYEELQNKEKNIILEYKENLLIAEIRPDFETIDKFIKEIGSDLRHKPDFESIKLGRDLNRLTVVDRKELLSKFKEKKINPEVLEEIQSKINNLEKAQKKK